MSHLRPDRLRVACLQCAGVDWKGEAGGRGSAAHSVRSPEWPGCPPSHRSGSRPGHQDLSAGMPQVGHHECRASTPGALLKLHTMRFQNAIKALENCIFNYCRISLCPIDQADGTLIAMTCGLAVAINRPHKSKSSNARPVIQGHIQMCPGSAAVPVHTSIMRFTSYLP